MNLTPELITAICTGVVSIIAALGAMIASIRNGQLIKQNDAFKMGKLREIDAAINNKLPLALEEIRRLHNRLNTLSPQDIKSSGKII